MLLKGAYCVGEHFVDPQSPHSKIVNEYDQEIPQSQTADKPTVLHINQIEKVQRAAARWTCRRWQNTSSAGEMLDDLEWPSLEARRDQSTLLLFHTKKVKINKLVNLYHIEV